MYTGANVHGTPAGLMYTELIHMVYQETSSGLCCWCRVRMMYRCGLLFFPGESLYVPSLDGRVN